MANLLTLTTPLMRQTVGFDRFNDLFEKMTSGASEGFENYPPYNIDKLGEDRYRITMAVAGFTMEGLNIVHHNGVLSVSGSVQDQPEAEDVKILHRGIGTRSFERTFRLADYIQVTGAELCDGLLTIHLVREVPEEKKPRMIPIVKDGRNRGG
ncbi:MAG: Hsp20 family protein [Micavibrio sp.]|nr:Hsp20 family protein [Micavibrio sp.]